LDSIIVIFAGLLSGFVASAPIGPINLLVAEQVMRKKYDLNFFVLGVVLVDMFFGALAFLGYHNLFVHYDLEHMLILVGGIFIVIIGFIGLFKKESGKFAGFKVKRPSRLAQFMKGVILCGTNPAFLLFWIFVAGQINQLIGYELYTYQIILTLFSIGIGTSLWFYMYVKLLKRGTKHINLSLVGKIRKGISLTLIIIGGTALISLM
jgi:threonine/homoserine/homoserine lactone efflux protein